MAHKHAARDGRPVGAASAVVAVVTRTKDRPLLLKRAAASVAGQTYGDLVWVVINDGGDADGVRAIVEAAKLPRARIVLLSHAESLGMEAAAEQGARAVDSRFIVIHDDDDSWAPEFLARTVGFLESARGRHYGGVVTHADLVSEEIVGEAIVEWGRRVHDASLAGVALSEMLVRNLFPPISFLFRREVYERVGGFNPRLPVLGDWYFNIRFLLEADIAVLPERLACWHQRETQAHGAYANSVTAGAALHASQVALVRNALVRDLAGRPGAALAPLIGAMLGEMRQEQTRLRRALGTETAAGVVLSPEGHEPMPPEAAMAALIDIADRRWITAQLPLRARLRLARARRADPTWADLMPYLARLRLAPPADFDEAGYRAHHLDVDRAVVAGTLASGYEHYVRFGRLEGRPRPLRLTRG